MTKLQGIDITVCTFCYNAHQRWVKNKLPFNKAKKEAIQICFVCKQAMCSDCVANSQEELEGHILAKLGLEICHTCIATVRRSLALKPVLDNAAREAIEHVRNKIEVTLYTIMQRKDGGSDRNIS